MRALVVILVLASVAYARPKRPRPSPPVSTVVPVKPDPNEMSPEDAAIALHFFDHFIDVVKGAMDCQAVATRINFVIDRNRELVRLMAEATAQGKRVPKATQDKMSARMMKELMPLLQRCMSDPEVIAALDRFRPKPKQPAIN